MADYGDYGGGYGGGDYGGGGGSYSGWDTGTTVSQFGGGSYGGSDPMPQAPTDSNPFTGHEEQLGGGASAANNWGAKSGGASSGGGSNDAGAQLNYMLGMEKLAEQMREFNTTTGAKQSSAQQAAGGVTNMVNEYNQAFAQAKGEYEQRYQQMLGIADATTGQQQADVRSQYGQQAAAGMQGIQRLGMGNTTLGTTMKEGLQGQQSQALNRLADQMQATKLGIIGGHKTASELAPNSDLLKAGISAGTSAAGEYGGTITQALGGIGF